MLHVLARRRVPQNSNAIIVRSGLKLLTLACTMNCGKLNWAQRNETNQTKRRQICHHINNLACVSTNALTYRQFNIQQFYVLPTQLYLCVLCRFQNKQRLFPYTTLTDWFV